MASVENHALKILSRKSTLRIALMTAMALLIAQFGAQAHVYSHLHYGAGTTEQLDSHGRLCGECLSFAPLLSAAGTPTHLFAIAPQGVMAGPSDTVTSLIARSPTASFRSRAPPSIC
jgi:hypothetical protein